MERKVGLDLLRGVSIFYIVGFWHLLDYSKAIPFYNNIVTLRVTFIILGTFVFISGYLIGLKPISLNIHGLKSFYLKRILRIYPLYFFAIILFWFFEISWPLPLIKATFLTSMFVKPAPPTLWFITMLMMYYVISPFLINECQKGKVKRLFSYYAVVTVLLLLYNLFTDLLDVRIIMYFPAFLFGIYTATNTRQNRNRKHLILFTVCGILISLVSHSSYKQLNFLLATPMVTVVPFFLFSTLKDYKTSSIRLQKIILYLSYSSYGMYLFHRPIYVAFKNIYFPYTHLFQLIYLIFICLPCIVFLSYVLQKLYDIVTDKIATLT